MPLGHDWHKNGERVISSKSGAIQSDFMEADLAGSLCYNQTDFTGAVSTGAKRHM